MYVQKLDHHPEAREMTVIDRLLDKPCTPELQRCNPHGVPLDSGWMKGFGFSPTFGFHLQSYTRASLYLSSLLAIWFPHFLIPH
jgi:hypothetical protein